MISKSVKRKRRQNRDLYEYLSKFHLQLQSHRPYNADPDYRYQVRHEDHYFTLGAPPLPYREAVSALANVYHGVWQGLDPEFLSWLKRTRERRYRQARGIPLERVYLYQRDAVRLFQGHDTFLRGIHAPAKMGRTATY